MVWRVDHRTGARERENERENTLEPPGSGGSTGFLRLLRTVGLAADFQGSAATRTASPKRRDWRFQDRAPVVSPALLQQPDAEVGMVRPRQLAAGPGGLPALDARMSAQIEAQLVRRVSFCVVKYSGERVGRTGHSSGLFRGIPFGHRGIRTGAQACVRFRLYARMQSGRGGGASRIRAKAYVRCDG